LSLGSDSFGRDGIAAGHPEYDTLRCARGRSARRERAGGVEVVAVAVPVVMVMTSSFFQF
jgi:hypothetical protein